MSVQVENLENNMAKLTIEVSTDKLEKAMEAAYLKEKNRISIPGFRKGKVPRRMIEKMYGPEIFYEDAANRLIQENYGPESKESGIDIVSRPVIDVVQIKKGEPFVFTAEVAVKPPVTLGKYKGVTVTKVDVSVSEEEIDREVERERNNNARMVAVEDRAIQEGDTVVIDYEGFVDGETFDGGKAENYSLEIGSHSLIDTFEEQLTGKNAGDEVEVNVVFPEEYHAPELAGKPAVFKVKIHEVKTKELSELDDEFAQEISEFDTLAEYRDDVKRSLTEKKELEARRGKENEAVAKIVEKSSMDIPEPMIETEVENRLEEFAQQVMQQGMSFEQYMQFTGSTVDKLKEQLRPEVITQIQNSLVLEQIAREENLEVTDEDVSAEIEKMAQMYHMEADKLKEMIDDSQKEFMKQDIILQKAVDFVMDHVKERAKPKKKEDEKEENN